MTPSLFDSRDGVENEGAKVTKGAKESEQGSLFEQPVTNKKELIDGKDSEIKSYIATKDAAIANKNEEIKRLNEKVQVLESTMSKKDGERDAAIANKNEEIKRLNEKVQVLESSIAKINTEFGKLVDVIRDFNRRMDHQRNWVEFKKFIKKISSLQFSVNFT